MKVTIKDVAREANVATSTVSRVLSNNPKISEETRDKVNEAIKKLNYKPNAIARSLAKNKTRTLGVVLNNNAEDSFANPFFVQAMEGISICVQNNEYYVLYAFSKNEEEEYKYIQDFSSSGLVDGVVLLKATENDKIINHLKEIDFPFVVIGRPEDITSALWVDNDNFSATYNAVNILVEKGHKSICFVSAQKEWNVSKDRLNGYIEALRTNGIDYNENLVFHGTSFSEEEGYRGIRNILENNEVKAVIATDDKLAFGINNGLKQCGVNNCSIIGFNNIPLTQYQDPPISSIDINALDLGFHAAKLLIDKLENKHEGGRHHIVETKLIERESLK